MAEPGTEIESEAQGQEGLGALFRRLADDGRALVRQEVELAKLEVTQAVITLARGSAVVGVGVLFLAVGLVVLLVFAILAVGRLLGGNYWLSTLVFGAIFTAIGLGLVAKGRKTMRAGGLRPQKALEAVRETSSWARAEAVELKRDLQNRERNGSNQE